jgi:hypothetical protein
MFSEAYRVECLRKFQSMISVPMENCDCMCVETHDTTAGICFHGSLTAHNSNAGVVFEVLMAVVIKIVSSGL